MSGNMARPLIVHLWFPYWLPCKTITIQIKKEKRNVVIE